MDYIIVPVMGSYMRYNKSIKINKYVEGIVWYCMVLYSQTYISTMDDTIIDGVIIIITPLLLI